MGPKKLAAIEQIKQMREKGLPDDEIRTALLEHGLSNSQVNELLPTMQEPSKMLPVADEMKQLVREQAVLFLESLAKRFPPTSIDRFPELGTMRSDALTWARKLKGAL